MHALLTPAPILASTTVTLMAIAFVVVSLFMMLVILIQKPKGGGLSGAFGGAGGGEGSFVGAKIGDFLTYLTVGCFIAFLLLAMGLTWTINPTENNKKNGNVNSSQTTSETGDTGDTDDSTEAGDADSEGAANQSENNDTPDSE